MKKYHFFGKSVMTALLVTMLVGATLGCSDDSSQADDPILQSIAVTSPPTKTVYVKGEALDISGLVVTGTYANGTTKQETVNLSDISGYDADITGTQTLTVTVGGKTATFTVTVNTAALQSIAITSPPTKVVYSVGEALNLSGLVVTGTYADGTSKTETVGIANVSGYNANTTGQQSLTVTLNGKTATFTVTVNAGGAVLQSIAITSPPTKIVYVKGDALDISGLVVTGTYADDTSKVETVSLSNVSGYDPDTTGTQTLTVTVGGKTATFTVTVNNTSAPPIGLDDLASAAGGHTADNPVLVTVQSRLTKGGWATILSTIAAADKYISLDLSTCTMTDTEFDPVVSTMGAEKITALILPDTAESIKAGTYNNPPFKAFTALTSISGTGVETVGDYAFYNCDSLTSMSLPVVMTIGDYAFSGCTGLTAVSLPIAMTIGDWAFSNCTGLTAVSLPLVETIGGLAFSGCPNLTTITIAPANTAFTVHNGMLLNKVETTLIAYPSASGDISLPSVIAVGAGAFGGTHITTVSLPVATDIGNYAFYYCDSLTEVILPVATTIGDAFYRCTSLIEVSLPATPPSISTGSSYGIFGFTGSSGTITISVPTGTVSAYTSAWGVSTNTSANGDPSYRSKYGFEHKAVIITDAAQ
ncbi:MAG: bacterial Ig-like domain-containing protein [Treponema sp.]|jgi:hypothetical protein|nr:bacterial Ig-like domain-containing protein [Treponema sp.]